MPGAAVLNGGYPALEPLLADGRLTLSREPVGPQSTAFNPTGTTGTRIAVIERQRVREAVAAGKAQVFDARTRAEYTGAGLRMNIRGRHIPTAINVPQKELLDASGRLKSPDKLAVLLDRAGFRRGKPVITHWDRSGRGSLAALAAERAGYGPAMNYYLSFGDWAADASCPVEQSNDKAPARSVSQSSRRTVAQSPVLTRARGVAEMVPNGCSTCATCSTCVATNQTGN